MLANNIPGLKNTVGNAGAAECIDMKKENITLVGMPGAGKSTVGVVLAKIAGYHFLDSDLLIQQKTGKLLLAGNGG